MVTGAVPGPEQVVPLNKTFSLQNYQISRHRPGSISTNHRRVYSTVYTTTIIYHDHTASLTFYFQELKGLYYNKYVYCVPTKLSSLKRFFLNVLDLYFHIMTRAKYQDHQLQPDLTALRWPRKFRKKS